MYADMIYKFGYVHCDPHAGNILVRKSDSGRDEIVLLDHGLYTVRALFCCLFIKEGSISIRATSTTCAHETTNASFPCSMYKFHSKMLFAQILVSVDFIIKMLI